MDIKAVQPPPSLARIIDEDGRKSQEKIQRQEGRQGGRERTIEFPPLFLYPQTNYPGGPRR